MRTAVQIHRSREGHRSREAHRSQKGDSAHRHRAASLPGCLVCLVIVAAGVALLNPAAAEAQRNRRPGRPQVSLPGGPVRQVILRSCTACHGIDDYAFNALDRAGWDALVEDMVARGAPLPDADRPVLLAWLVSEFGPDSTPFPRDWVVEAVDGSVFAEDEAAGEYLRATCSVCHSLDRVNTARFDETRWRTIVTSMRGRGAAVAEENVSVRSKRSRFGDRRTLA